MYRHDDEFQHEDRPYQKLDDKIKELNSTRVFKKITPKGDLSWYIKWFSSVVILTGMVLTATNIHPLNLYLQFIGVLGWFFVGMLWHDRALIVLNAVGIVFLGIGIIKYLGQCNNCMIPL